MNTRKTEDGTQIDIHVGTNIRSHRIQCGLTQTELAARIGTNKGRISRHESGKVTAFPEFLAAVAKALDCQPSDFFAGLPGQAPAPWQTIELHELAELARAAMPLNTSQRRAIARMMRDLTAEHTETIHDAA